MRGKVLSASLSVVVVATIAGLAASCGSDRARFDDSDADIEGGGPIFGGADAGDIVPCRGLQCQQQDCGSGDTTVTGTVFAPNGKLPLYNAIVYVPNDPLEDFARGVACDQCGKVSGSPVVTALSDSKGKFVLHNVPVGTDIPLVIQVGKWRREVTISEVKACVENPLTNPDLTRLPKNQSEGSMPQIALTTGQCDKLGCMLPKIGIDASEFGTAADGTSKSVHVYMGATGPTAPAWGSAQTFWSDVDAMKKYDMLILSCECSEHLENKGGSQTGAAFGAVTEYMKAGGRIFTTDFMYTWYRYTPDTAFQSATNMRGGAPVGGSPISIDTTFPKGLALKEWLDVAIPGSNGKVQPDVVWGNVISVDVTKTQKWGDSPNPLAGPRIFTVNLPAGVPAEQQCGKGVHIDAHINQSGTDVVDATYPNGCNSPLKPGENLLAFFLFDLASCIQNEAEPPKPPPVK